MIPKLGQKRRHHFAHKSNIKNCNEETYLHQLSKQKLYYHLEYCKDNNREFCIKINEEKHNLFKYYQNIFLEKQFDDYRPDITLVANNGKNSKMFIELVVTHKSTEKKKNKNKIIEIYIKNENDISELIDKGFFEEKDQCVEFINFKNKCTPKDTPEKKIKNDKSDNQYLVLNKNGEIEIKVEITSGHFQKTEMINYKSNNKGIYTKAYHQFIVKCAREKLYIKHCYLCINRKSDKNDEELSQWYCEKQEYSVSNGKEAIQCKYYCPKDV